MSDSTKGCLALISLPLFLVAAMFTYGWATQTLWAWFAVPLGAPPVTLAQAYGLSAIIWLLTNHQQSKDDSEKKLGEQILRLAAIVFARPALSVGVAWLFRWAAS